MNYYERHIGDYLKDTAHLSLLEHGVYTRLMDVYYTRESAIPEDQVARLIGARSKEEREALEAVLSEFFERTADGWR
ncbi:MAG TPA: YdaU family protein, partial [Acidovorax sp.]|nr:YdaU family protein [Acidovorax sp.]